MTRDRTLARPLVGWMNAKSSTNSFSVWLMRTRLLYVPWAMSSSIWICSLGAVGSSGMGRTLPDGDRLRDLPAILPRPLRHPATPRHVSRRGSDTSVSIPEPRRASSRSTSLLGWRVNSPGLRTMGDRVSLGVWSSPSGEAYSDPLTLRFFVEPASVFAGPESALVLGNQTKRSRFLRNSNRRCRVG